MTTIPPIAKPVRSLTCRRSGIKFTSGLTERRYPDRVKMAELLEEIARKHGATTERHINVWSDRCISVCIKAPGGLRVSVDLDGASTQPDVHVIPWNIALTSDATLEPSFGSVNPHHFQKATHVAYGWEALAAEIERGLVAAADGSAYAKQED